MPLIGQSTSNPKNERIERLAVNLYDITNTNRLPDSIRQMLLLDKLDLSTPIRTDPERLDEAAVAFNCDLLSAACIIDVLRSHDRKAGDYPTRAYLRRASAWNKLPGHAVLTEVVDGKPRLNPDWFPQRIKGAAPGFAAVEF